MYDKIASANELPIGWTDEQQRGTYRLHKRNDDACFAFNAAPQSWKRFLYPPVRRLFSIKKNGKSYDLPESEIPDTKYAFVGVRPCELSAILVQDRVFQSGDYKDDAYFGVRRNLFIVAVNCSTAGGTCFCSSMNTGPEALADFDLSLTEVIAENEHYFVVKIGSEVGDSIIRSVETVIAGKEDVAAAEGVIRATESSIDKKMMISGLPKLLVDNLEHPQWDDVAKRCLACGNCTLVCPTCFCSTVEDVTILSGENAERVRRWDSCFSADFSKVAGGNFRISAKSRYRQWLTHKLSSWVEQFGVPGCVGCGRCITWCPVGIDITEEVRVIRDSGTNQRKGD